MKPHLIALISGFLFGLGLAVSQMVNPEKVLSFLDITGNWDPSLALVLGSSVIVTFIGFRLVLKRTQPFFSDVFHLPKKVDFDKDLISGSIVFGIGWGIAGYCPGPSLAALALGAWEPVIFVIALIAGSLTHKILPNK